MQTSQPKPCPFCGKADELSRNPFTGDVVCDACGASVDEGSWNNRPVEDALREAADNALNALIGCAVAGDGADDRTTLLEAQQMLRAALRTA